MILFETHATSLDNEAGLASGWFDVDLSSHGEEQAAALGTRYRTAQPGQIYTSDLRRAWRTAGIAFGDRIPVTRDSRLRECNYGELTRQPAALVATDRLDRIHTPFPNGESYSDCAARVRSFLADLASGGVAAPILIIGHRATWYALEHLLNGRPLRDVIERPWEWQAGWQYLWPSTRALEER